MSAYGRLGYEEEKTSCIVLSGGLSCLGGLLYAVGCPPQVEGGQHVRVPAATGAITSLTNQVNKASEERKHQFRQLRPEPEMSKGPISCLRALTRVSVFCRG